MRMTDEEIWKYLPLAYKLATKFCKKRDLSWDCYEDARQEAAIALIKAGRIYDPKHEKVMKLGCFLATCILRRLAWWLKKESSSVPNGRKFCESQLTSNHRMDVSHGIHSFELDLAMRRLDWMERDILYRNYGFFGEPEIEKDIAKDYKIRRERVNDRKRKARSKLREMLT